MSLFQAHVRTCLAGLSPTGCSPAFHFQHPCQKDSLSWASWECYCSLPFQTLEHVTWLILHLTEHPYGSTGLLMTTKLLSVCPLSFSCFQNIHLEIYIPQQIHFFLSLCLKTCTFTFFRTGDHFYVLLQTTYASGVCKYLSFHRAPLVLSWRDGGVKIMFVSYIQLWLQLFSVRGKK